MKKLLLPLVGAGLVFSSAVFASESIGHSRNAFLYINASNRPVLVTITNANCLNNNLPPIVKTVRIPPFPIPRIIFSPFETYNVTSCWTTIFGKVCDRSAGRPFECPSSSPVKVVAFGLFPLSSTPTFKCTTSSRRPS